MSAMDDFDHLMTTLVARKRSVDPRTAESLVRTHYGIDGHAELLTGERDENFWIRTETDPGFVLKIANAAESSGSPSLPMAALVHLERTDPTFPCPRVVRPQQGPVQITFKDNAGTVRTAVLVTFLPGKPLLAAARSVTQRVTCGRLLARLARALRNFEHPAAHRTLMWDLMHLPKLASVLPSIPDLLNAEFITDFVARFAKEISPRLAGVRRQFVHNDFNARNIIVDSSDDSRITGIIDFGDSVHTALVADAAVGAVGQLFAPGNAEEAVRDFIRAYCEVEPLQPEELHLLNWLIAGRIVQNVTLTSWHRAHNPADEHFDGFDAAYFEWRVAFAQRLVSSSPSALVI